MKKFIQIPNDLMSWMTSKGLTASERFVFLELVACGPNWAPSRPYLAKRIGSATKTISRCFRVLEAGGYIEAVDSRAVNGGQIRCWSTNPGLEKFDDRDDIVDISAVVQ